MVHKVDPHQRSKRMTLLDGDDAPELTAEFFKRADEYRGDTLIKRGRPKADVVKERLTVRMDPVVLARWRASGKGWQTRMAQLLAAHAPEEHK